MQYHTGQSHTKNWLPSCMTLNFLNSAHKTVKCLIAHSESLCSFLIRSKQRKNKQEQEVVVIVQLHYHVSISCNAASKHIHIILPRDIKHAS